MGRSLTMAVIITVLQVATATAAAYAFVFLRFPFKRVIFAMFMATLLLPLEVLLVGNIETIRQLEWINTMQALVLPFGASTLGTFLIRQGSTVSRRRSKTPHGSTGTGTWRSSPASPCR